MKTDGGLRPMFRDRFPEWQWTSIETMTVNGVPDAEFCYNGSQAWCEYKFTNGWQVALRPEQIGWNARRARAGGRSFIIVRRTSAPVDDLYIFPGAEAARLKAVGLRGVTPALQTSGGPARWNWEMVSNVLLAGSTEPARRSPLDRA